MAKLQLKGIIQAVSSPYKVGKEQQLTKQTFNLMVPGYVDQFMEKKGKDEWWNIDIIGDDNIAKFKLEPSENANKKAIVDLYLNSSWIESNEPGKADMYIIKAVLSGITFKD